MRTTLDLDDDILEAAKELARSRDSTAGKVISDLVRRALAPKPATRVRNGVPLMSEPAGAPIITMDLVNRLRDD